MAPSVEDQSPDLPRNESKTSGAIQPVDIIKVVKARQNLLYIQKENSKIKVGHADESLNEVDALKQYHLEMPAL